MEISSSLQNTYIQSQSAKEQTTNQTATTNNTQTKSTIGEQASDYVDLGDDLGKHQDIDPVQEKTNQELIDYLSKLADTSTSEGKKNAILLEERVNVYLIPTPEVLSVGLPQIAEGAKEMQDTLDILNLMLKRGEQDTEEYRSLVDQISGIPTPSINKENPIGFTPEEMSEMASIAKVPTIGDEGVNATVISPYNFKDMSAVDAFKNLYSFTDSFAKTPEFEELYLNYREEKDESDDINSMITQIVSQSASKSEVIEHYTEKSNSLKELLNGSTTWAPSIVTEIQDSLELYDKISSDLKDKWGFGDLDISA